MKITFFGTQPYDRESFDRANERYGFEFNYHRSHLNGNNTSLAQGADAVCIFVNDTADAATIRSLAAMDVKLIALRCAGFNNVDLKAAAKISANKKADLIPMKELLPVTGYIRGGCSPIGMKKAFPTYIHATAAGLPFIYVSAGVRGLQLKVAPSDLAACVRATFAEISRKG